MNDQLLRRQVQTKHLCRVQSVLHLAAALIRLLSFVTEVELPYPLVLRPLGFEIQSAAGENYPLYVLTEQPGDGQEADLKKSAKLSLTDQAIKLKLNV